MSRLRNYSHICKCGRPATRHDSGELTCDLCATVTDRAIKRRLGTIRLGFKRYGTTFQQFLNDRPGSE
jgi:hypothetical protein